MMDKQAREMRRMAGALVSGVRRIGLEKVEDPRVEDQVKRPLSSLLMLVIFGIASRQHSLKELELQSSLLSPALMKKLKQNGRVPDTTIRSVLMKLNHESLRELIFRQVRSANRSKQLKPVGLPFGVCSIDGKQSVTKNPIGEYAQSLKNVNILRTSTCCLVSASAPIILDAVPIPEGTNEMGVFENVLNSLIHEYGRSNLFQLISADAGMNSLKNANLVVRSGFDYLFAIKGDQKTLLHKAEELIGPQRNISRLSYNRKVIDRQHTDIREVWVTGLASGYYGWEHLRSMIRVRRTRIKSDGTVVFFEDRYFVSSLKQECITPSQWLLLVRSHWRVENEIHNILDVFYDEDAHPWIYSTPGQLSIFILRRVVLNINLLYRNVSRNSQDRKAKIPWKELIYITNALIYGATESLLSGLRWPGHKPSSLCSTYD